MNMQQFLQAVKPAQSKGTQPESFYTQVSRAVRGNTSV